MNARVTDARPLDGIRVHVACDVRTEALRAVHVYGPQKGGTPETLDRLRASGTTLAVVSNKPASMCSDMLIHFRLDAEFAMVVGGDTLAVRKPDPGPILHVLAETAVPPERALMVGDGTQDMMAGRAAGVTTVAALYGFRSREILEPTRPDHWIETIGELIGLE